MNAQASSAYGPRIPSPVGGGGLGNVALFDLLDEQQIITTTLDTAASSPWDLLVLTGADFEPLGKAIEDIVIDCEVTNLIAQFQFFVAVQRKFRNGDWGPSLADIVSAGSAYCLLGTAAAPIDTAEYKVGAAFTDRTKFGVSTRLVLFHQSKSSGSGRVGASARISMQAAVRFWGS